MVREYGSNFEYEVDIGYLPEDRVEDYNNVAFLSNGRECLYAIGKAHQKNHTVLMPALCCLSMVQPFRQLGRNIQYYDLNDDLTINMESLGSKMSDNSILLIMHYYGRNSFDPESLQNFISNYKNIIVIQDCTQNCFSKKLYNGSGDYYIGSLRKWMGIPDGAFVASRNGEFICHASESDAEEIGKMSKAMQQKALYMQNGDMTLKQSFRKTFAEHMQLLKGQIAPHRMSEISGRILKNLDTDMLCEKRRNNYNRLLSVLSIEFPYITKYCVAQNCPLCLPVVVSERDNVQRELAQRGIYTQVLWPLPDDSKGLCAVSDYFSGHMLAVPIDQRYSESDMDYIYRNLIEVLRTTQQKKTEE